jgi:hypothetical protein
MNDKQELVLAWVSVGWDLWPCSKLVYALVYLCACGHVWSHVCMCVLM